MWQKIKAFFFDKPITCVMGGFVTLFTLSFILPAEVMMFIIFGIVGAIPLSIIGVFLREEWRK